MNCIRCGEPLPATARFCPACAAPVAENLRGGAGPPQLELQRRRRRIAIAGGIGAALALVLIGALIVLKPMRPNLAPGGAPAAQPPRAETATMTPAQIAGFDWSGLSPEQLQAARAALDEAIAKEEQAAPRNPKTAPRAAGPSAR